MERGRRSSRADPSRNSCYNISNIIAAKGLPHAYRCSQEIKAHEYRVGLVPAGVHELVSHGHEVLVESGAGLGIGVTDAAYEVAGATIADSAEAVFAKSEMIVKVKEPQAVERQRLREGHVLFTFLHLAPDAGQTRDLVAVGMGAEVTVIDRDIDVLRTLVNHFGTRIKTAFSTHAAIAAHVAAADLVVGGVLVPGAAAPRLVTEAMVAAMAPGSVAVDVAIDQGGCFETARPTTHAEPTYMVHDVIHYCVANMPGAGGPHLDLRPDQRHPAVRPGPGRQGLEGGAGRRSAPAGRAQRASRQGHLPGRRRGPRLSPGRGDPGAGGLIARRRFAALPAGVASG